MLLGKENQEVQSSYQVIDEKTPVSHSHGPSETAAGRPFPAGMLVRLVAGEGVRQHPPVGLCGI